MTPRRAFVIGNLILAGCGTFLVVVFGSKIYHWYLTGDLWIMSRSGLGQFTTYGKFPVEAAIQFGIYTIFVGVGIVCIASAIIIPVYYRRQLMRRD
jgi:hypothetical protein